jgi:phytoene synthase
MGCTFGSKSAETAANAILAAHGKSFYWARRFLGPVAARQATLLYAFCRRLDDIADADSPSGLERLKAIDAALAIGVADGDDHVATFLSLSSEINLPVDAARDLIAGLMFDQGEVLLADEDALIVYAYQVAGTVGLMMSPILGSHDPLANAFAIDLGIAMQLTNIARDVAEDADLGRRYLPASWSGPISPSEIRLASASPLSPGRDEVAVAIAKVLVQAEIYYTSGLSGLAYLPIRNDLAIGIAATVYQAIGHRLRRRRYAWWKKRQVVGVSGKILATGASLPRLFSRRAPSSHDERLHRALKGIASVDALH